MRDSPPEPCRRKPTGERGAPSELAACAFRTTQDSDSVSPITAKPRSFGSGDESCCPHTLNCFTRVLFIGSSNTAPPPTCEHSASMVSQSARIRSSCLIDLAFCRPADRKNPIRRELRKAWYSALLRVIRRSPEITIQLPSSFSALIQVRSLTPAPKRSRR